MSCCPMDSEESYGLLRRTWFSIYSCAWKETLKSETLNLFQGMVQGDKNWFMQKAQ